MNDPAELPLESIQRIDLQSPVAIEPPLAYIAQSLASYWSIHLFLFGFSHTSRDIRRILVVRTDRLGDVVLTLPMLPVLRTCFPAAHIAMLLKRYTGEIVEGNPYVDELLWYDEGANLVPFFRMCRVLREKRFDAVIVVYPRPRLAALMACSGIPLRVGTGYRFYSVLFTRRVFEHRKNAVRHEVEYNMNLLRELDCRGAHGVPEFYIALSSEVQLRIDNLLESLGLTKSRRIVVVHPGSGGSAREWPAANFGQLATRLLSHDDVTVMVTGSRGEERKVAEVLLATGGKAVPLIGMLSVKELAALLRISSLFVSNSTGPLHVAAAVGTPVLGLYPQHTAMSVKRWGPLTNQKRIFVPDKPIDCRQCVNVKDEPCVCMASIGVDEVYQAAMELLGRRQEVEKRMNVSG